MSSFARPAARNLRHERALGFTVRDLEWLHTLYYATHAARQDATVHGFPMQVDRLLVNLSGQPAIVLAGAFLMSPTPDDGKAVLYTPYGGLELFDHRTTLISTLEERLTHPSQRSELLQFVSIDTRDALPAGARLAVTTAIIQGAVMQDQEQAIRASQQKRRGNAQPIAPTPQPARDARHLARDHGPPSFSSSEAGRHTREFLHRRGRALGRL